MTVLLEYIDEVSAKLDVHVPALNTPLDQTNDMSIAMTALNFIHEDCAV